jgi:chemotaxis signal transduction protein
MMETTTVEGTQDQKAIVFPALAPEVTGKRIYFLFSISQVVDIVNEISVHAVPFSHPFIAGISQWRNYIVPVLSLEACLGLKAYEQRHDRRGVVIRSAIEETGSGAGTLCMLEVEAAIRMFSLPLECEPARINGAIAKNNLIRGFYEWKGGYLVVAEMEKIMGLDHEANQITVQNGERISTAHRSHDINLD